MITKFRAWHYELGRMMSVKTMWFTESDIDEVELNDSFMNDTIPAYPKEIKLMHSTGSFDLKTKAQEIFEDDIVKWTHPQTGQTIIGIVQYDRTLGFWGMTDKRFKDGELSAIGYLANQCVEVIGNVWETPELVDGL